MTIVNDALMEVSRSQGHGHLPVWAQVLIWMPVILLVVIFSTVQFKLSTFGFLLPALLLGIITVLIYYLVK